MIDPNDPSHTPATSSPATGSHLSRSTPTTTGGGTSWLVWLFSLVLLLFVLRFIVPYVAEQIAFAINRGKQRAEYETAGEALEQIKLTQISQAYQLVSKRVAPSVVNINVLSVVELRRSDDLESLFGPKFRQALGQGSGVVVDNAGYILTNNHVVANATEIQVALSDGPVVNARIVGLDPLTDLALLKVDHDDLTPAEWGDSDALEVGSLVWAVGSPFGLQHSITSGILSGKNRQGLAGSIYYDFLQTDAAVNPGNSGGPLVDARGRVVGINTAIYGDAYQGISFAIPSNEAKAVYERLKSEGRVARGWLGVELETLNAETAKRLRLPVERGVLVIQVVPNSPAEEAGLQPGDVVLQWDGSRVNDNITLSRLIARTPVGSSVELLVQRGNQQLQLSATIAPRE